FSLISTLSRAEAREWQDVRSHHACPADSSITGVAVVMCQAFTAHRTQICKPFCRSADLRRAGPQNLVAYIDKFGYEFVGISQIIFSSCQRTIAFVLNRAQTYQRFNVN